MTPAGLDTTIWHRQGSLNRVAAITEILAYPNDVSKYPYGPSKCCNFKNMVLAQKSQFHTVKESRGYRERNTHTNDTGTETVWSYMGQEVYWLLRIYEQLLGVVCFLVYI